MTEHKGYIRETLTVSEDVKIPGTEHVLKKGSTFELVDATEEVKCVEFEIKNECKIPNTDLVLEKGDKIQIMLEQ